MITSDQEKHWLEALTREQDCTCNEAVKQVQTRHLWEMEATADAPCRSFKRCSASQEGDSKQTCEESPEYGTTPRERGCSLQQMDKHKADQIPALTGKRCPGSRSYTPCKRVHTPHNHSQSGHHSSSRCRSHSRCCSCSATPNHDRHRDHDSTSRKWPVDPKTRPTQPTPTQSPTQKTPKLKSVTQRAPTYQHFPKPPYKSLRKEPKDFIRYLQGSLDRKVYDAEIRSMAVLHNSTSVAHRVIASTITTLVAATRGIRFMSPVIPMELMNMPNNPTNAELPVPPTCSKDYQSNMRIHCVRKWAYLLKLLQYWHDANSLYEYGRPVCMEGKLMLFVFYLVNEMLNPENLYIQLHEIMDSTPWHRYYLEHHSKEDREAYFRDHVNIIQGLEHLRDCLKNWYLAKAHDTWHHLKIHSGDIDHLPYPRSYEDQCPGNECMFYRNWGATMEDVKIRPENAPRIANMMIEALAQHDHWQREARDCQEYQQQLDSTNLPRVAFPPPRTTDWDVTTELDPTLLEGVVGATAAPEPLSSTMASEPSESTVPVPEKKKITLDKYNHHKALKLQQTAASPNLDENGERLDYDNFELEDDPDNIQIDYQTPALSPASSQQTSIPPLEDTPMPMSPATTQSEVSTSPGSVLSTMGHTPTAVNRAPGFSRGLPVWRTMPIRVGAPQDSTSPMQIGTPHSLSLPPLTSSSAWQITPMQEAPPCQTTTAMQISTSTMLIKLLTLTYSSEEASGPTSTAEDELLQGVTLLCSPWQEASLLNIATPVELTEGHWKMMETLGCLEDYGLQFICESAQALSREWTLVRATSGYFMLQVPGAPLAHEFYRATSNLGTTIVVPLPASTQQPPAEAPIHHPDPEIEAVVINMECHEQASRDTNNNPQWGSGPSHPSTYITVISLTSGRNRRPSSIEGPSSRLSP